MLKPKKQDLKLENVKVWFKCVECQGYFYALPLLKEHFLEEHKDKRFILPKDLPSGARDGKVLMKNSPQPGPLKNKEVEFDICSKSFKTQSALNFHIKKPHRPINASEINYKAELMSSANPCIQQTEMKSSADPCIQQTEMKSSADPCIQQTEMKSSADPCIQQTEMISGVDLNHSSLLPTSQKVAPVREEVVKTTTKSRIQRSVNANDIYCVKNGTKYICCVNCPYQTNREAHYISHLRLHKTSSTAVTCSLCGWFVNPQRLNVHYTRRHVL